MEFVVVPSEKFNSISQDLLNELNINPRYNEDKTKILLHLDYYLMLFPAILNDEIPEYKVYSYGSEDFYLLLESSEWNIDIK